VSASGHPLWFNPPDCLLSDGTIVQMMVKDFMYLEFTEYVGPMCDLEVFASLGHPRICFDCIHSTSSTEILLPPLPPPCLLEVWYRLFNVILVALCRLCYVQCAMPHTILPYGHISISCFYVPCLLPVLSSFAK